MANQVMTANSLADGQVVYLTAEGQWSLCLGDAEVASTPEAIDSLTAVGAQAEADHVVVGAYLIDVVEQNDAIIPVKFREQIRAKGPTTREDLGKQAS